MTTRHCYCSADLISYASFLYFTKHPSPWETSLSFPICNPFPAAFLYQSGNSIFYWCPSICGTPQGNVWLLMSAFYMPHLCMLVADHFSSNVHGLVYCPLWSFFNLILVTTVVGTFPLSNVWCSVVSYNYFPTPFVTWSLKSDMTLRQILIPKESTFHFKNTGSCKNRTKRCSQYASY